MDAQQLHGLIRASQRASTDLFALQAVIDLLEGSSQPSSDHDRAKSQIVATCKREMQRALTRMDKADAAIKRAAAQKEST